MASLIGIPGAPRDARCGAVFGDDDGGGSDSNQSSHDFGMASVNASLGGPAAAPAGGTAGGANAGFGLNNPEMGGDPARAAGLASADLTRPGFRDSGSYTNQPFQVWQSMLGLTPDNSQLGAWARDVFGVNNPGGFLHSDAERVGQMLGTAALSMVNPLAGMGFNTMASLARGRNPGGVFGSQVGGFGGGQLGTLAGGAFGPPGALLGGILGSQAGAYAGGRLGATAYSSGYSAPASQGPQGFGQTQAPQPAPASAPAVATQFAGLSQPAVTAPVSNPVANPLRALLLALGPRAGINLPLLFGGVGQQRSA